MRTIVHLDADAFFAAVEQAADAKLRGKPIAVGGHYAEFLIMASYEKAKVQPDVSVDEVGEIFNGLQFL